MKRQTNLRAIFSNVPVSGSRRLLLQMVGRVVIIPRFRGLAFCTLLAGILLGGSTWQTVDADSSIGARSRVQAPGSQTDIAGPTGSGSFGSAVKVLPNGNIVVTDPGFDLPGITDVGAIYLYDGATGALISRLTGNSSGDIVGDSTLAPSVTTLSNGNFVVTSPRWDNIGVTDAGAATLCSGTTGCSGAVSAANSLVGSLASNTVGSGGATALINGGYVVSSPAWDSAATQNIGAVTLCSGTSGCVFAVSTSNSLVGSTGNDFVGAGAITVLTNSNYIVRSPFWANAGVSGAGAVTFCNGTSGCTGVVGPSNSLVGTTSNENIGQYTPALGGSNFSGIFAFPNGNYAVVSDKAVNGSATLAGAVTYCSGTTGRSGTISSSNSLIGSATSDSIGRYGLTILTNGNYVVASSDWTGGKGAATFCNGAAGCTGTVSTLNSLVGGVGGDFVGRFITALTNGNYVVSSPSWTSGNGAVTFCSGTSGCTGQISGSNSLLGNAPGNQIGSRSAAALTNGNYVVNSPAWDDLLISNVGAANFCSGASGCIGSITESNSLFGTTADDTVGDRGFFEIGIVALTNGNYVVASPAWDKSGVTDTGAATWCSGTTGCIGPVSAANSLTGNTASDRVSSTAITPLTNGNYVVSSGLWNSSIAVDAGAVTCCSGTLGCTGTPSPANSLVGTTASDGIGTVTALPNGDYVVYSPSWDNGAIANAGAVTYGKGAGGTVGEITAENSVRGLAANSGNTMVFAFDSTNNQLVVGRRSENIVSLFRPSPATSPLRSRADFDGDGRTDLSVFRNSDATWYLSQSRDGLMYMKFGLSTDTPAPGDYDNDGRTDIAVFRPDTGFFVFNSNTSTVSNAVWGSQNDIPVSGDYDGDGKADFALFRSSDSTWYVLKSTGGFTNSQFGASGDLPIGMDNDGDGKANLAVYRSSNNTWYIARASGVPSQNFDAFIFGTAGDKPVAADFDGDNKDDIAVFRPATGTWWIQRSQLGLTAIQFGANGDVPVPGDYDGDGKDDVAVFRGGTWFVNRTTSGLFQQQFGSSTDTPIPKRYIP